MWYPRRDQAYIGVLIDDLITRGTQEPYRMFTSRAEYRLLLREDNADLRLTQIGHDLGLVDSEQFNAFCEKRDMLEKEIARLNAIWVNPGTQDSQWVAEKTGKPLSKGTSAMDLLRRPELHYCDIVTLPCVGQVGVNATVGEQVEIQAKYSGYIARQEEEIKKQHQKQTTRLPNEIDYQLVSGLSNEIVEKLNQVMPSTIGEASRIPGMTPAAISLLLVHLKKQAKHVA